MTDIVFKLEPEIIIGNGTINRTGTVCKALEGNKILLISEKKLYENKSIERLNSILADSGVEAIVFDEISSLTTADIAETTAELVRGSCCSAIIGFGGSTTQAITRLTAIITPAKLKPSEFLDGAIPNGQPIPYITIPTVIGDPFLFSNAFVTVDSRDRLVKLAPASANRCVTAIIDSSLAESPSKKYIAAPLFDGFCTAVEAYCSTKAQFISDTLLERAFRVYARLMDSYEAEQFDGLQELAVEAGFLTALASGVSVPGIGTALAYALNGRFPVKKSWCSTVLLPFILERLMSARPEKIAKIAALIGESVAGASTVEAAHLTVEAIRRHMKNLQVPSKLSDFNLSLDRLVPIAEAARNLAFVSHCPWTVTIEDAYDILKQAF
ncbi:MAG: iron-containing alcohol dehydrogenase [Treponema sp.]|jgi:alcohol dehydrogenase|nr:iron-containing alcohol dehydrogenase [Treponema sp.]